MVAVDGKIYVLGGFTATTAFVPAVRIYDPATCTWSDGPALPRAVHHVNAAVAGGTIYVLGALADNFAAIGDVWSWNPASEPGWTVRASMPPGSERGAAVTGVIDGRIYVTGGLSGSARATVSAYTIASDTWDTTIPSLPRLRDHGCGGTVGGKLYVVGGRGDNDTITGPSKLVFEYTPGGSWLERSAMPTGRAGAGCGIDGDRIVVAGGEGNGAAASGVFSEVEVYTVSADRWDSLDPMPTPRHGMGAAFVDGVLFIPGGATRAGLGAVDTHDALRL